MLIFFYSLICLCVFNRRFGDQFSIFIRMVVLVNLTGFVIHFKDLVSFRIKWKMVSGGASC